MGRVALADRNGHDKTVLMFPSPQTGDAGIASGQGAASLQYLPYPLISPRDQGVFDGRVVEACTRP